MADAWKSTVGERARRRAFARDKAAQAPCWICKQPIDYSLGMSTRDGNPNAWEPDHYWPRADYPELSCDLANIRPSHRRCNRARGKKFYSDPLGSTSREW